MYIKLGHAYGWIKTLFLLTFLAWIMYRNPPYRIHIQVFPFFPQFSHLPLHYKVGSSEQGGNEPKKQQPEKLEKLAGWFRKEREVLAQKKGIFCYVPFSVESRVASKFPLWTLYTLHITFDWLTWLHFIVILIIFGLARISTLLDTG